MASRLRRIALVLSLSLVSLAGPSGEADARPVAETLGDIYLPYIMTPPRALGGPLGR